MSDVQIVHPYQPHEYQRLVHEAMSRHRFGVLVCHRRWGKTFLAVNALIHSALTCPLSQGRYGYIAPFYKQAKQAAWDYFKQYTSMIPSVVYNESELRIDLPNGSRIRLYGADRPDSLRGIYLDGVVLDEVADMRPQVWGEVVRPLLADRKGWALFIGTPKGVNLLHDLYMKGKSSRSWFSMTFRVDETKLIPDSELESARADMSDKQYAQEFLCDFSASSDDVLIPLSLAIDASKKEISEYEVRGAVKVLGVDVARYGDDICVIQPVEGLKAYKPMSYSNISNIDFSQKIIRVINDFHPDHVRIDAGRGEGVIDYLKSQGYPCTEVNFGGAPSSAYYSNLRAEMWDGMRKWLESGGAIPSGSPLLQELSTPTYGFSSSNKMVLESKDSIKKRGLSSPDYADALALAVGVPLRKPIAGSVARVLNKSSGITSVRRVSRGKNY